MPCCQKCGKCGSQCDAWLWFCCCSRNKCRRGPLAAPNNLSDMRYADAACWSYVWAVGYVGYIMVQLLASHLPLIITSIEGHPEWWSNCESNVWCLVLGEHVLILVSFYWLVQALFIFFKLNKDNMRVLLWFYIWGSPGLAVYYLLENLLFTSVLVPPPDVHPHSWEAPLRAIEMLYLVVALPITWYAHWKVYAYLNPKHKDGIIRPRTINEVRMWVLRAARARAILRCVGASHSAPGAIFGSGDEVVWRMSLTYMRKVTFLNDGKDGTLQVDVQGGCNLGLCPTDPNSTLENSLNVQVNNMGYSLQDLGGITEQTVAGFLSTGSSGGTRKFDIFDDVYSLTMVNGKGEVVEHIKGSATWPAAAISLGCFGIVVGVKLHLKHKKYWLKGVETGSQLVTWGGLKGNTPIKQVADAQIDLAVKGQQFGKTHSAYVTEEWMAHAHNRAVPIKPAGAGAAESKGADGDEETKAAPVAIKYAQPPANVFESVGEGNKGAVVNFFDQASIEAYTNSSPTAKDYYRWMWYPQLSTNRAVFWSANRSSTSVPDKPYKEIPLPGITGRGLQSLFNKVKSHLPPYGTTVESLVTQAINTFVDVKENQQFSGIWHEQLPMDNQMPADTSTKIEFFEMWVPIEHAAEVTNTLHEYFAHDQGMLLAGTFAVEMYACKGNDLLLSPAYHDPADTSRSGDVFRVDFFWVVSDRGNPQLYFNQFYYLFASTLTPAGIPWRWHLGKYWPDPQNKSGGLQHVRNMYGDRIDRWNEMRKEQDPDDVFLTSLWAARLGLPGAVEVDWVNVATNETQPLIGGVSVFVGTDPLQ